MTDDRISDFAALLDGKVQVIEPALMATRRDIHAHPELGMDAPRIAALVASVIGAEALPTAWLHLVDGAVRGRMRLTLGATG